MPGFMHPCGYCSRLIPPDSAACPFCGRVRPLESPRCPACRSPVETDWVKCASCGISLRIKCPKCGQDTFFGDYCTACAAPLTTVCASRRCRAEQPLGEKCIKCGKSLK